MANMQLVIFEINDSEYGIDALSINGILRSQKYKIQRIPGLPCEIEGMINLRGQVSYIINLRNKFGLGEMANTEESKFIMLNINDHVVGCIVDEVTDIVHFNDEEIQPAPTICSTLALNYIKGIGKVDERMIIILDPAELLSVSQGSDTEPTLIKLSDLGIPS